MKFFWQTRDRSLDDEQIKKAAIVVARLELVAQQLEATNRELARRVAALRGDSA